MLFREYIQENSSELKSFMEWLNYDISTSNLPVVELIKDHALEVLSNTYGKFEVDDIHDEMKGDIRINFPTLLQQLSITLEMISENVVKIDILSETTTRTETGIRDSSENIDLTLGSKVTELNELNTTNTTIGTNTQTGTVLVENDTTTTQNSDTNITNTSGVDATGSRNVNLSHSMPEQTLNETGNFPKDSQGTPELDGAFVQSASESFSTVNPIETSETSQQNIEGTVIGSNDTTTTNDLTNTQNTTVTNSGDTTRTVTNSGTDTSVNSTLENTTNEVTESVEREATNAQYAYEIKAFLESTDALNAFQRWVDKFSWVCGVI